MIRYSLSIFLFVAGMTNAAFAERMLISVNTSGAQSNNTSTFSVASTGGRYVAFTSAASNLADGDIDNWEDIFVHDTVTGETELISVTANGTQAKSNNSTPSISDDGRFVAFYCSGDLFPDDHGLSGICIKDRQTKTLEAIRLPNSEEEGSYDHGSEPDISADGSLVVFHGAETNPWRANVFIYDRGTKVLTRLTDGNDDSHSAVISANNRYVAFYSEATDLVPNDTNTGTDTFVFDRETETFERVSVASNGTQGLFNELDHEGNVGYPGISADGRYVVFMSKASNLVDNDTNGKRDIFVHDRESGTTERVSIGNNGEQGTYDSEWPDISQDGRFVAFYSRSGNFVPGDDNNYNDIFVRDRVEGNTVRVAAGNHGCQFPSISPDGTWVAHESYATDLVSGDENGKADIFLSSVNLRLSTTICSEWNGFFNGGMWNIMELVNMSDQALSVDSTLYNIAGSPEAVVNSSVLSGAQTDLIAHDISGWIPQSYGRICSEAVRAKGGDLDGRMVYYKPEVDPVSTTTSFEFAFAMPFLNGTAGSQFVLFNTFQPSLDPADQGNFVANWIQLTNLETTEQAGTLYFYAQDGSELGTTEVRVAAGARQDFSGHQFGAQLVGMIEWRPQSSTATFQFRNVRYLYDNPGSADSFDTAFQLEGLIGSGELLVVPLDTQSASSILEIANVKDQAVTAVVNIYDQYGRLQNTHTPPIPAHGSVHIITDGDLSNSKGIATIQGSSPSSLVAVVMQYGRKGIGGIQYMYGIPAKVADGSVLRSSYNTFLKQDCRLLLVNPTSGVTRATLSMVRYDGTSVLDNRLVTIYAHGLIDYDLCGEEDPDNYGVVTVVPSEANSLVSWVVRIGNNNDYRFPTPVRQ